MTDTDYKAALEEYETNVIGNNEFGYMNWVQDNINAIKHALEVAPIADRVNNMKMKTFNNPSFCDPDDMPIELEAYNRGFNAAIEQLLKEVGDD